jgi:hypothetical protein
LNNCGQFRVVRDISIAPVDMKVSCQTNHFDWPSSFYRCPIIIRGFPPRFLCKTIV